MKRQSLVLAIVITGLMTFFLSCRNESPVDLCAGVTITVSTSAVTNPTTGQSNGSFTATATGGGDGVTYIYVLNPGSVTNTTGNFNGLAAGSYTVTATNPNGCVGSTTITLTQPNICSGVTITVTPTVTNIVPCVTSNSFSTSQNNGSITASAIGGTAPYTYSINGGPYGSGTFNSLAAGSYTINAKDANGCIGTVTQSVAVVSRGPLFSQMRTLITAKCGGSSCHMNGGAQRGYNFDDDCSIVRWKRKLRQLV
jgi:hypothetical protein